MVSAVAIKRPRRQSQAFAKRDRFTARTLESPLLTFCRTIKRISFAENSVWRLPVAGFLDCVSADPLLPQQRQFVPIYQKLLF
jgi:hypothetical protein